MSKVSGRLMVTSFVPRQVMLETAANEAAIAADAAADDAAAAAAAAADDSKNYKHKKKKKKRMDETVTVMEVEDEGKKSKKKKFSKISNAFVSGSDSVLSSMETLAFDRPRGDVISWKWKEREDLLRSIAAFLEDYGFTKTLSVFRSEAQIEVNSGVNCINLEDLFDKFIELSKRDPVSIEWSTEKGKIIVDDLDVETKDEKKEIKQVSDSFGQTNTGKNHREDTLKSEENINFDQPLNVGKKKNVKAKFGENMGEVVCRNTEGISMEKIEELKDLISNPLVEMDNFEKDKGEKKKKKQLGVNQRVIAEKHDDDGGAYASTQHQESVNLYNLANDVLGDIDGSRKDKKKNKNKKLEKLTSDSPHTISYEKLVEETSDGLGKHNDGLQTVCFRKDSIAMSKVNTTNVDKSTKKKRKRSSYNETVLQVENITATSKSNQIKPGVVIMDTKTCDHKVLTCNEPSPLDRELKESSKAISSTVLDKHEENFTLEDPQNQLANGSIEKHQKKGNIRPKSMKKEKLSTEPKTVGAFQRVKVEHVQFADERLQDNSYWALDNSGSGYGAKAQEVLGQVRGRDFRHEKTKKKRGTYRGGQIDLQSHSIKFNYSDDE